MRVRSKPSFWLCPELCTFAALKVRAAHSRLPPPICALRAVTAAVSSLCALPLPLSAPPPVSTWTARPPALTGDPLLGAAQAVDARVRRQLAQGAGRRRIAAGAECRLWRGRSGRPQPQAGGRLLVARLPGRRLRAARAQLPGGLRRPLRRADHAHALARALRRVWHGAAQGALRRPPVRARARACALSTSSAPYSQRLSPPLRPSSPSSRPSAPSYVPYPGGSEFYVHWLATEAVERGWQVTVLAGCHKGDQVRDRHFSSARAAPPCALPHALGAPPDGSRPPSLLAALPASRRARSA